MNFDRKKEERKKKDNSPLLELLGFAATKNEEDPEHLHRKLSFCKEVF